MWCTHKTVGVESIRCNGHNGTADSMETAKVQQQVKRLNG
jgi:hypothetical protein